MVGIGGYNLVCYILTFNTIKLREIYLLKFVNIFNKR